MRSVVHVTMGNPEIAYGGILIPMGLMVSDDDSTDELPPTSGYSWMKAFVSHQTIAQGNDFIKSQARNLLEEHRMSYAGSAFHKIVSSLEEFIDKNDLSIYNIGWFPDPLSATVH